MKSSLCADPRGAYSQVQRPARLVYAQLTVNRAAGRDPMIVPATYMHDASNFETMKISSRYKQACNSKCHHDCSIERVLVEVL